MWKPIPEFEGYEVSVEGMIRSVDRVTQDKNGKMYSRKGKILSQTISKKGYAMVQIVRQRPVHRLVALAFIPNPENKPQVNHIDGDKTNNDVSNLEWVTNSENLDHAYRLGLRNYDNLHNNNYKRSLKVLSKSLDGEIIKEYDSVSSACRAVEGSWHGLNNACKSDKVYKGFTWHYAEPCND